ncbi:MaoC family dehydratase [Aquisalimonas lutea]|uniref:MaoC family dehydratase n=1 Tax=Aquisalimonas lutea TaxID=1327750 RepID=UPI0025B5FD89|nr:MaoC family dehydratase [Aquisalimonas lutea]MDN3516241.1 MaoC family dehydratase [Aquisalimonas lutea]
MLNRGYCFEDLEVGMEAGFSKTVTEADLANFAGVSSDFNPLHMDETFAADTRFGGRIAHGMLSGAYLSAVLGMHLPGPGAVYLEQSLRFRAPVRIGDRVVSRVEVRELMPEKNIVTCRTEALVGDKAVVTGEAVLMVPSRV